ncbi:ladderlectin-like [Kryptolebias marmoratus]|uniref:Ladderlectin-like n=1 Tax=Kryptolebias marmoratus TaxID=37003 RepID=A0A3Q2ZJN9_KRYMA|nr:ladderlectin-like [Kryptolebias marmoratus]
MMGMQRLLLLLCSLMLLSTASGLTLRFHCRRVCPRGWTPIFGRCFKYVPTHLTWAQAERNCLSMHGNLASVHSLAEYHRIQWLILRCSHYSRTAWIGGFDAVQEGLWFWADGSFMRFTNWCPGEPNNAYFGRQHCMQMNYSGRRCWDDHVCNVRIPSVCVRKRSRFCG